MEQCARCRRSNAAVSDFLDTAPGEGGDGRTLPAITEAVAGGQGMSLTVPTEPIYNPLMQPDRGDL